MTGAADCGRIRQPVSFALERIVRQWDYAAPPGPFANPIRSRKHTVPRRPASWIRGRDLPRLSVATGRTGLPAPSPHSTRATDNTGCGPTSKNRWNPSANRTPTASLKRTGSRVPRAQYWAEISTPLRTGKPVTVETNDTAGSEVRSHPSSSSESSLPHASIWWE